MPSYYSQITGARSLYLAALPQPELSNDEILELQTRLTARGYDVGEPDGKVNQGTTKAIQDIEREKGIFPTGRPSKAILQLLRQ